MRSTLRAIVFTLRMPYIICPTGYLIDYLPYSFTNWLFTETPSERIERRLHLYSR